MSPAATTSLIRCELWNKDPVGAAKDVGRAEDAGARVDAEIAGVVARVGGVGPERERTAGIRFGTEQTHGLATTAPMKSRSLRVEAFGRRTGGSRLWT